MRTLAVVVLAVALTGGPAHAVEPLANGTRGVVVAAQPGQDVQLQSVDGRQVPGPVSLHTTPLGEGLVLVDRPIDLPVVLSVGGRTIEAGAATGPAVARVAGSDRQATALATARTRATDVAVAAPTGRVDLALLAATGPWPVLWSAVDAASLAPQVVDLADFPNDIASFAVAWDRHVRGDQSRERVFLVTDADTADLAAVAALGETTFVTGVDQLPQATADALAALSPMEVVVVGGRRAVSEQVFTQVQALAPTVRRLAGADRVATALLVRDLWPRESAVAVVRPDLHADAVAAASLGLPVVFSPAVPSLFGAPGCRSRGAIIVGGRAAVPDLAPLPSCRMTAFEIADDAVAELQTAWTDLGSPSPARVADVEAAVAAVSIPLDVTIEHDDDGIVTTVEFTVSRVRSDGSEFSTARWEDGDLAAEPERVDGSSTVEVRD